MVDCYIDHPDSVFRQWNFSILNSFCFSEFLRYYYNVSNNENIENNNWPEEVTDELVKFTHCVNSLNPHVNDFKWKIEISQNTICVAIPFPKREIHPEEYAHHFLFVRLPFTNENELNYDNPPSYTG